MEYKSATQGTMSRELLPGSKKKKFTEADKNKAPDKIYPALCF